MNHSVPRGQFSPDDRVPATIAPPGLRAVHRAIGEARRGVPVVVHGVDGDAHARDQGCLVAVPAETVGEEMLAVFSRAASGEANLLVSALRAAGPVHTSVQAFSLASLSVEDLHRLADPTHRPPGLVPSPFAGESGGAAVALSKLARLLPATLVARVRQDECSELLRVSAQAILAYPAEAAAALVRVAEAAVPMAEAPDARDVAFRPPDGGIEHLAILIGQPEAADAPLVRVHSECFTGDMLGSLRCDCGPQLHQAIRRMAAEGAGVLLYMAQEGRGIGLVNKLRAYALQDTGLDTLDANKALGFEADERSFMPAAVMLKSLGITRIRLLTNNPEKIAGLTRCGIDIAGRVSHAIAANGVNDEYLQTKALRFGHLLG